MFVTEQTVQSYCVLTKYAAVGEEAGLEVNAENTEYVIMSREQNAGHNHNMQIANNTVELGYNVMEGTEHFVSL
jgi:UDP-N-acetylglucosamine transferase subunit ALG13